MKGYSIAGKFRYFSEQLLMVLKVQHEIMDKQIGKNSVQDNNTVKAWKYHWKIKKKEQEFGVDITATACPIFVAKYGALNSWPLLRIVTVKPSVVQYETLLLISYFFYFCSIRLLTVGVEANSS